MKTPALISVRSEDNNYQRADVIKRNREKRFRYGQFLVEGVSQITLAMENGWVFEALLFASGRKLSSWAGQVLENANARAHYELAPQLLAKLSEKDEPSELLAIVEMRKLVPAQIPALPNGLVVAFDRPASPGNLGSSIRSADAFGVQGVIVTGHAVDVYDPYVVRGSMGALFSTPVATAASHTDVADWVTKARELGLNFQVIGSSGKTDTLLSSQDLTRPTLVVLGNETVGMSKGYWDICDAVVKIPIGGKLSSLNVSCAASILLYEATRQRAAVTPVS
jgi:tRNA G18 (ribose-2'-O)-methylase SpoU